MMSVHLYLLTVDIIYSVRCNNSVPLMGSFISPDFLQCVPLDLICTLGGLCVNDVDHSALCT